MIVFLHTSSIHVSRFNRVLKKFQYHGEVAHFVNEELLQYALMEGKVDRKGFEEQVRFIQNKTDGVIICTCSTYGGIADELQGVVRVDRPLAEYMVAKYSKIGVAYTAKSTALVTVDLLKELIGQRNVVLELIDCTGAWKYLEDNKIDEYNGFIIRKIRQVEKDVEAIYLAQASMDGVEDELCLILNKEVLSSSYLGVKEYLV